MRFEVKEDKLKEKASTIKIKRKGFHNFMQKCFVWFRIMCTPAEIHNFERCIALRHHFYIFKNIFQGIKYSNKIYFFFFFFCFLPSQQLQEWMKLCNCGISYQKRSNNKNRRKKVNLQELFLLLAIQLPSGSLSFSSVLFTRFLFFLLQSSA